MDEFLTRIENYDKPKNGVYNIYLDYYWIVDKDGFPLVYREFSNQCNKDIDIISNLFKTAHRDSKIAVGFKLIPVVYIKHHRSN